MKMIDKEELQELKSLLHKYFPDSRYDEDYTSSMMTTNNEQILVDTNNILDHLQTILFEEHLLEVQVDHSTRVFFTNLLDNPPSETEEQDNGNLIVVGSDYEEGAYLKDKQEIFLTPLTPGIGNARVRSSKQVILRYFTGTVAIELGCTFKEIQTVDGFQALHFTFPVIGRINRSFRPYRVKALSSVDARIYLENVKGKTDTELSYQIVDVSSMGLAFQVLVDPPPFSIGENIKFTVRGKSLGKGLVIGANIRHITKVRDKKGYKNICGVQFDLETRFLAAEIERLAAAIQRLHLRELSEKVYDLKGVNLVKY